MIGCERETKAGSVECRYVVSRYLCKLDSPFFSRSLADSVHSQDRTHDLGSHKLMLIAGMKPGILGIWGLLLVGDISSDYFFFLFFLSQLSLSL